MVASGAIIKPVIFAAVTVSVALPANPMNDALIVAVPAFSPVVRPCPTPFDTSATVASELAHVASAVPNLRHLEYFHDHHRIEQMLFDGALSPEGGALRPDQHRPGFGLEFKHRDAEQYRVA